MPITEGPQVDERTFFIRALFELMKDDDTVYRQRMEERLAAEQKAARAAAAKEARRERLRAIARLPRTKKPGSRPWQTEGFATRQAWVDAGSPEPVIPPTKRELIEQAIRVGERKKQKRKVTR